MATAPNINESLGARLRIALKFAEPSKLSFVACRERELHHPPKKFKRLPPQKQKRSVHRSMLRPQRTVVAGTTGNKAMMECVMLVLGLCRGCGRRSVLSTCLQEVSCCKAGEAAVGAVPRKQFHPNTRVCTPLPYNGNLAKFYF